MPSILITPPSGECVHVDEARIDRRVDDHYDDAKLRSLITTARQAAESKTRQQLMHARWQLVLDAFPSPGSASFVAIGRSLSIPPYAIRLPHAPLVAVEKIEYLDMAGAWQTMPTSDYIVNVGMTPPIITPCFGKIWPIPLPQIASVKVTYTAGYASLFVTGGALTTSQIKVSGPVTWKSGDSVRFYNSGGVLPAPLCADSNYLIASVVSAGIYTLNDDAGSAVTFIAPGTGRNYIGVVPEGIRSWMLLRIGSLYDNREEAALLNKGRLEVLPWADGLLDPYMSGLI
jgi:hypothetical protein